MERPSTHFQPYNEKLNPPFGIKPEEKEDDSSRRSSDSTRKATKNSQMTNTPSFTDAADPPDYLKEVYTWAYLNPKNIKLLDRPFVVSTLLFGNANRLIKSYLNEVPKGAKMLHLAHVYGDILPKLAQKISEEGQLDLIDIAPQQLAQAQKKLEGYPQVNLWQQDASLPYQKDYNVIGTFFLLHEVPSVIKARIVNNILQQVEKNNAKAIFIDYHNPAKLNPIRQILRLVNRFLEPFANEIWQKEIERFAQNPERFHWQKETFFGGVYQKVVVTRR